MSEHTPLAFRQVLGRILLLLAGLTVLPAALLESLLWLGSVAVSRAPAHLDGGAEWRILCVGDSHTYGVYFPEELSYPRRLQSFLVAHSGSSSVVVRSDALPGRTAATMLERLPRLLAESRPQIVLLLGGLNDRWNRAGESTSWWQRLRLLRVLRIALARNPTEHEGGEVSDGDAAPLSEPDLEHRVSDHIGRMIDLCKAAGSTPVVLTYAASDPPLEAPNRALRSAAAAHVATLIDVQAAFGGLLSTMPYDELLIPRDFHPRPAGYEQMAKLAAEKILELMGRSETVDLDARPAAAAQLLLQIDPSSPHTLEVAGPRNAPFRVYLSTTSEPPVTFDRILLPIGGDRLFLATRNLPELLGELDAEGRARLSLALDQLPADVAELRAVVVTLKADPSGKLRDEQRWEIASNAIEIELERR